MESAVEVRSLDGDGDVGAENVEPALPSVFSSEIIENPEDISEDWVSLFLDPSILDERSSSLPSDFEPYPDLKHTLEEPHFQCSSEDLLTDSLKLNSPDDYLLHSDCIDGSSANLVGPSFAECSALGDHSDHSVEHKPSEENPISDGSVISNAADNSTSISSLPTTADPSFQLAPASYYAYGASAPAIVYSSTSPPTSSLYQLSGDSYSGSGTDICRTKEAKSEVLAVHKGESSGEVSSGSERMMAPTNAVMDLEMELTDSPPSHSSELHSSSHLVHFGEGEGEGGASENSSEAVSSSGSPTRSGNLGSALQSESFGVRSLQSIGNAIKMSILGRSGNMNNKAVDTKGPEKLHMKDNVGTESLNVQIRENSEDQHSDHCDGDKKGELGDEDDEKRRARLSRNRESAQQSRQRKKVYVDELESRLRTMAATVAELNATINHLTAENVNLRRQLGYYYQPPGLCPRMGMPVIGPQVLPMGPYPGMVGGRPMYPSGPVPPVPIPRLKTQTPARSSKRSKSAATKEDGGDKKRAKKKVAGAASVAVMSLLCVAMIFGPFDWGNNSLNRGVDNGASYSYIGNVRVGGRVLTSWGETENITTPYGSETFGPPGWVPLKEGEYGPEIHGVPSVHTRLAAEKHNGRVLLEVGDRSSEIEMATGNRTLASPPLGGSHSQSDCFGPVRVPILMGSEMFNANTSQPFPASVFVPRDNGLVKVDGNLIIQAVMAGDKAAKQSVEKKQKNPLKKAKKVKNSLLAPLQRQLIKAASSKALDNVAPGETKSLQGIPIQAFVNGRALPENKKSVVSTSHPVTPVLHTGSLPQWVLGGLHALKKDNIASETKMETSQLHIPRAVDNHKAVAATQGVSYSLSPYAAFSRGPLHSWIFAGLSTAPLPPNGSETGKEMMPLLTKYGGRFLSALPSWDGLPPVNLAPQSEKKAGNRGVCSLPARSNMFWAPDASTGLGEADSQQCFPPNKPLLSTGVCTELFQFDTSPAPTSPDEGLNSEAKDIAATVASKATQGNHHNLTSKVALPVAPRSRRDPFAVPLPPVRPKSSSSAGEKGNNGTDPGVEDIVKDHMKGRHSQDAPSTMVVSVLAGPEEYGKKGGRKGMSQVFVVVLVNSQKYVTYSCILPHGDRPHVVAD